MASQRVQDGSRRPSSVFVPRLVLGTTLVTAICLPSLYQPLLSSFYNYLYSSRFYRWSYFETVLTVLCYGFIEPLYTYKFGHNPQLRIDVRRKLSDGGTSTRLPKMRRPQARLGEMILYVIPLLALDLTMIKKFADVPLDEIRRSGGYDTFPSNFSMSPSFLLPTLHNFKLSSPVQLERALPPFPPTSRRLVLELAAALFIYDAVFFATHLAFHRIGPLAKVHHPHHIHSEMHPQITNRLSIPERLSLVMLANFALNIIGSHVLTRTCFVPLFVYLLIEIHSGMELDWSYEKLMPTGWSAGPRAHAEHHRTGGGGYAPFFRWWDHLLQSLEYAISPVNRHDLPAS